MHQRPQTSHKAVMAAALHQVRRRGSSFPATRALIGCWAAEAPARGKGARGREGSAEGAARLRGAQNGGGAAGGSVRRVLCSWGASEFVATGFQLVSPHVFFSVKLLWPSWVL